MIRVHEWTLLAGGRPPGGDEDWLLATTAPWWAAVLVPLVTAFVTFVLTRSSTRKDADRTEQREDRFRLVERKQAAYADFQAALIRRQRSFGLRDDANNVDAAITADAAFSVIKLIAPPSVVVAAEAAFGSVDVAHHPGEVEAVKAFVEAARADLAAGGPLPTPPPSDFPSVG